MKTKKNGTKNVKSVKETEAQKAKRLGPSRKITRFVKLGKTTRMAHLACGHKRVVDLTTRKSLRCHRCLVESTAKPAPKKKAA